MTTEPGGVQSTRFIDDGALLLQGPGLRPEVMRAFRLHLGSPFIGLFPAALFDQVAMVEVAASVDATGRFAQNFADRGVRSGLSAIGAVLGNPTQRAESAQWLKQMHREVHGRGKGHYENVRYSALNPEQWTWIANSTTRLLMTTFPLCTGIRPTPTEQEAMYQFIRNLMVDLELPSETGKLPATWIDFEAHYNSVAESKIASSPFPREKFAELSKLPLPTLLLPRPVRAAMIPLWYLIRGYSGHLIKVCSAKAMHPAVAAAIGYQPSGLGDLEFQVIIGAMHTLWRVLPEKLRTDPFTYERLQLEQLELDGDTGPEYTRRKNQLERRITKLITFGQRYQLDTFGVPESRGVCPMAG